MKYYNGDIKETKLLEGVIKYYYAENQSWQTTMADGTEIIEFSKYVYQKYIPQLLIFYFNSNIVGKLKRN